MKKVTLCVVLIVLMSISLNSEDIKEEFVKKGWENALIQIKSAEVHYEIKSKRTGKTIRNCFWRYKNKKERLDVIFLDEKGNIEKRICLIGKEGKTIMFSPIGDESKEKKIEGVVGIYNNYTYFHSYMPPSEILFRIPFFTDTIEEAIQKSKLIDITSTSFKIFIPETYGIYWEIFLSKNNFLPQKIIINFTKDKKHKMIYEIYYKEIEKTYFPEKVEYTEIKEEGKNFTVITYENIKINKDIDEEIFNPKFSKGTIVSDTTIGITYEIK